MLTSVRLGFVFGALVAMQVGPMSLFLIRSTLRRGLRTGLAIGSGVALVDASYAGIGAAGVSPILLVPAARVVIGAIGVAVLGWLGVRALMTATRVRHALEVNDDVDRAHRAFLTSIGATASNPSTILSWAAIFGAASSVGHATVSGLVAGVAAGSLTWVTCLALLISAVRRRVGPRGLALADGIAGIGMLGFAGVLSYDTMKRI